MSEKKVVAVIVEGPSDEAALGTILKEYFSKAEVQFVVVHGDITAEDYTTHNNIVKKINDLIDVIRQRYRYKLTDFLKIIHIVDMDGVFTKNTVFKADVESVMYYTDRIETKNPEYIEVRNQKKSRYII